MDWFLPQAYLIALLVILGGAAVVVARQILRVRSDERSLIRLEERTKGKDPSPDDLYELGSVQLRKRLYGQAASTLKQAAKQAQAEPAEAQALIQNALGFALAAQSNYATAIRHYRSALKAKPDYPVALNNLAYALERQGQPEEALSTYEKVLQLDGSNKTARKRLKSLERKRGIPTAPISDSESNGKN
jgi:tetratricopeptide (TPR) repeat protein